MSDLFTFHLELHDLSPSGVRIVTKAIQTRLRDIGTFGKDDTLELTSLFIYSTVNNLDFSLGLPPRRRKRLLMRWRKAEGRQ